MTRPSELKSEKITGRGIDLAGEVVGELTVIGFGRRRRRPSGSIAYEWLCECACGSSVYVDGACLRRGSAESCGCKRTNANQSHGMSGTKAYSTWLSIKARCRNPNHKNRPEYADRGIDICERWAVSFEAFHRDMGNPPSEQHTIERIDNDGDYTPGNCRWATRAEQNENTRQTRLLAHNGEVMSVGKWAKRLGIDRKTITTRIDRLGWSVEKALTTIPKRRGRR